jgi:hypothetical protein
MHRHTVLQTEHIALALGLLQSLHVLLLQTNSVVLLAVLPLCYQGTHACKRLVRQCSSVSACSPATPRQHLFWHTASP